MHTQSEMQLRQLAREFIKEHVEKWDDTNYANDALPTFREEARMRFSVEDDGNRKHYSKRVEEIFEEETAIAKREAKLAEMVS